MAERAQDAAGLRGVGEEFWEFGVLDEGLDLAGAGGGFRDAVVDPAMGGGQAGRKRGSFASLKMKVGGCGGRWRFAYPPYGGWLGADG